MTTYFTIGVISLIFLTIISLYNNLVRKKNETENAFGSVDAMLKKRYDLIPNLVETVKKYMVHEAGLLQEITNIRSGLTKDIPDDKKVEIHNDLTSKLNNVILQVENYPDLKASRNFLNLQGALNDVEEQISAARRFYNDAVTKYNNAVQVFPSNIIASVSGFHRKEVLVIDEIERKNVDIKKLFN
ncbi:MAG: LemA family protein [Bacteroidales bacterium]|nr:LemA family protein [Bacteroidales bacterium]